MTKKDREKEAKARVARIMEAARKGGKDAGHKQFFAEITNILNG